MSARRGHDQRRYLQRKIRYNFYLKISRRNFSKIGLLARITFEKSQLRGL
jgi:hypothetical protein